MKEPLSLTYETAPVCGAGIVSHDSITGVVLCKGGVSLHITPTQARWLRDSLVKLSSPTVIPAPLADGPCEE